MTPFLYVMAVLYVMSAGAYFVRLHVEPYPRRSEHTKLEDCAELLIRLGFLAWIIVLLVNR